MKINIRVKVTNKFNDTMEFEALDVEHGRLVEVRDTLIKLSKDGMIPPLQTNREVVIEPVQNQPVYTSDYTPASDSRGAKASQKQINFMRALGFTGDASDLSVSEANEIIKQLKESKI